MGKFKEIATAELDEAVFQFERRSMWNDKPTNDED